jgi:protein-disulfide isomerase
MKVKWDSLLTAALVCCALLTTALVVRQKYIWPATTPAQETAKEPIFIEQWHSYLKYGFQFGLANAPVKIIEFVDFECPYCSSFHQTLKTLRDRLPNQVSLTYIHFPLPMHRFAVSAARVVECAGKQGRFEAMSDRLFREQHSFGFKPWMDYAAEAGVPSRAAFEACINRPDTVHRIEEGKELGVKLDVKGVPTLIVNGWMLERPPSPEELNAMVEAVLDGKSPVSRARKS